MGLAAGLLIGALTFDRMTHKIEGIVILDYLFIVFYPVLGVLTGAIYKVVKE